MADDYSAIATPVQESDDYSRIADPVDTYQSPELKAYNPSLVRQALTKIREGLSPLIGQTKTQMIQGEAEKAALARDIPGLAAILDQAPKGNEIINREGILPAGIQALSTPPSWMPQLPSVGYDPTAAPPDSQDMKLPFVSRKTSDTIAQIVAGTYNTGSGIVNTLPSPMGVALMGGGPTAKVALGAISAELGKVAVENAIPTAQTLANPDASVQEKTEAGLGEVAAGLGAFGGLASLKGSLKPTIETPKGPSIVTEMDGATHGTPAEANVAANEIATKPIQPIAPPPEPSAPANAGDVAIEAINKNIRDNAPPLPENPAAASETPPPSNVPAASLKDVLGFDPRTNPEPAPPTVSRYDKANYDAYIEHFKEFNKVVDQIKKDPTNVKLNEKFVELFKKNEELKNLNGGWAPEPPSNAPVKGLLEGNNFDKEWQDQGGQGGSENQLVFKDGKVYKRNYNQKLGQAMPNYAGDLQAFKDHIDLHNDLFQSAKITLEGFSETSDGPAPVTSQPEIKGKEASAKEIRKYMMERDFVPSGGGKFTNADTGIEVSDLTGRNVLKDNNGDLHVIDPQIKRIGVEDPYAAISEPVEPSTQQPNAVQVQSPEGVSVPAQTENSQGMGQEVRSGVQEPAAPRQEAQVEPPADFFPPNQKVEAQIRYKEKTLGDIESLINRALDSPSVDIEQKRAIRDAIQKIAPGFPDTFKKITKDLPLTAVEALKDRVAIFQSMGRDAVKDRAKAYNEEREALASALDSGPSAALNDTPLTVSPGERIGLYERINNSVGNKIRSIVDGAAKRGRSLLVRDVMLDMLDGNAHYDGPLSRIVGGRIDLNYNTEHNLRDTLRAPIADVLKKYKLDKTSMERISIYAIAKQENGLARLADSGVSPEVVKKVSSSLTEGEKAFYETARKIFDNEVYPKLKAFMHDNYNLDVQAVKNYWPFQRDYALVENDLVQDPLRFDKGDQVGFDEMATWRSLENDFRPTNTTKTQQGMTVARVPEAKGGLKLNAAEVVERHIRQVSHLLANQRDLKMLGQIARTDAFKAKYGNLGQKYVLDLLDTVSRDSAPAGSTRSAMLDWLTKNTSVAILGFRLLSQLKHGPNVAFSIKNVRPDYLTKGLIQSFTKEGRSFIEKNFAEINQRFGGETSIAELASGTTYGKVQAASFLLERGLDSVNARATVLGRYMQELADRGIDPDLYAQVPVNKNAQRKSLLISRQSVTSPLRKDTPQAVSRGQLVGNNMSLTRALFQFQNTMLRQAGYLKHDIYDLGIKEMDAKQLTTASLAFLAMIAAETGIVEANRHLLGAPTKKPQDDSFLQDMALETTKRAPFVGNLISAGKSGQTGIPIADTMIGGVHAIGKRIQNKNDFGGPLSRIDLAKNNADIGAFLGGILGVPGASTAAQAYKNQQKK